jgi:hypothetical protein
MPLVTTYLAAAQEHSHPWTQAKIGIFPPGAFTVMVWAL